jgi:hypothetical protein
MSFLQNVILVDVTMNPLRFKVKSFVAVQYRGLRFGNYRAEKGCMESRVFVAGGCTTYNSFKIIVIARSFTAGLMVK